VALGLLFPGRRRIRTVVLVALMGLVGLTVSCGGGGGSAGGGGGGTTAVATTTQLTVSSTKVALNGPLNLSATVTGGTPIGTVAFVVDGAAGYANNLTNGSTGNIPTMTTGNFGIGTHTVVASYSGAPGSAPSQSGALNVAVTGSTVVQITGTSTNTSSEGRINVTVN
jgi:Bacterial Ig-like domain (group 3)